MLALSRVWIAALVLGVGSACSAATLDGTVASGEPAAARDAGSLAEDAANVVPSSPTPDEDAGVVAAPADDAAAPPTCGGGRCAIRVRQGRLERDGQAWVPKGAVVTGFVAPAAYLGGVYAQARAAWGPSLLTALRALGADTIRFNVSVAALDPTNAMPDGALDAPAKAAYLDSIKAAVDLVEQHGMNAMLTMQTGDVAGDPNEENRPGPATARAWRVLAPVFANDPAVVLIAFNEPGYGGAATIDTDPSPWLEWRAGFGLLVDAIRQSGASNVIVLDGLATTSRVWRKNTDANLPSDPLGQLAFDIHPFPTDSSQHTKGGAAKLDYVQPADIDHWLDGWCDAHACAATAFFTGIGNDAETANCYDGRADGGPPVTSPEIVRTFANHFASKGIGLMLFAADWKNRVFEDPSAASPAPTTFAGFKDCGGPKRMGPGAAMKALWTTGTVPSPVP